MLFTQSTGLSETAWSCPAVWEAPVWSLRPLALTLVTQLSSLGWWSSAPVLGTDCLEARGRGCGLSWKRSPDKIQGPLYFYLLDMASLTGFGCKPLLTGRDTPSKSFLLSLLPSSLLASLLPLVLSSFFFSSFSFSLSLLLSF